MSHINEKGGRRPPCKACSGLKLLPHKQLTNFQLILWSIPDPWLEHAVPLSHPPCKKGARWNTDWAVHMACTPWVSQNHIAFKISKTEGWLGGFMAGEGVCACVQGRVAVVGCVYVHVRCSACVMSRVPCQSRAWCGGCDIVWALRGTDTVVVMVVCAYECVCMKTEWRRLQQNKLLEKGVFPFPRNLPG